MRKPHAVRALTISFGPPLLCLAHSHPELRVNANQALILTTTSHPPHTTCASASASTVGMKFAVHTAQAFAV